MNAIPTPKGVSGTVYDLDGITQANRPMISLTNLNIEAKNRVTLRGRGRRMSDVFKFVTILENSPSLKGVKTTYTSAKKVNKKEFAEFEINCLYEAAKSK